MGNINHHLGDVNFDDPNLNWEWGPTLEQIREQFLFDEATRLLHQIVHGEDLFHYWITKTWNKIDFRECLSDILKCDTTTWDPDKLCEEVNKLHPRIKMIPYRHKKNHYWIRKKYDYEQ